MAEDFVELGIEGVDKLVDKHFHRLPDRYIDPHTYLPRCRRHERGGGNKSAENGESDTECEGAYDPRPEETYQRQRMNRSPMKDSYGYGHLPSSQQPREQATQEDWGRRRSEGLVRRSSSQPGNFTEDDRERQTRAAPRRRRRRSLSDERRPNETKAGSRRGSGHEKGPPPSKTDAVSLTLLGIAAASLAASGVMTVIKHRDRTKELQENTKGRERNGKDRGEDSKASKREGSSGGRRDKPAEGRRTKGGGGRR
jgi:hypothetical protein